MANERPRSLEFPDLSDLDNGLTANLLLETVFRGNCFHDNDTCGLVLGLVRTTESAVRGYERARSLLVHSVDEDSLGAYLEGLSEMEVACTALYRAMRVAERLLDSPVTIVNDDWLPSEGDRELLRHMRNAIDHVDGPISSGRCGQGERLFLFVAETDLMIDEGGGNLTVSHTAFGEWVRQLHILASELTRDPATWTARKSEPV